MEYNKEIDSKRLNAIKARFDSNLVYQEHLSRYNFVMKFIKDKFILDSGCGIGNGTYNLSLEANKVIGTELDRDRLRCAFDNFSNNNISYLAMDGCLLGFKDSIFDIAVSLEVIEHLEDQDKFVSEVKRVLKNDGIAIISTPNKEVVKIEGTALNPSHIKELTFKEFKKMLNKYFREIEFYGQKRAKGIKGMSGIIHRFIRIIDIFRIRKLFSQNYRNKISSKIAKSTGAKETADITAKDFEISKTRVGSARNIIAICKR